MLKDIVLIGESDYSDLVSDGEIVKGGVTHSYDSNNLYIIDNPTVNEAVHATNADYATSAGSANSLVHRPYFSTGSSDSNKITLTVGGWTTQEFAIPYASYAGDAASAGTANYAASSSYATSASSASNLTAKPILAAGTSDTKKITVTAGGKKSDEFTVPFATSATSASKASHLYGGASGSIPFQTGAGTTSFLAAGTNGQILALESGSPKWKDAGSTHTHSYLPLSGGALTGKLSITSANFGNQLVLNRSGSSDTGTWGPSIVFQNKGTFAASLGCDTSGNVYIGDNGTNKYKIWHENNDGSGSGLDADKLDGKHASEFAPSGHTHNGGAAKTAWGQTYVNASGSLQTISGNMTSVGTITATGDNTITKTSTDWAKFKVTNNNGSVSLGSSTNRGVYDETKSQWIVATNTAGTNMWTAHSASVKFGIGTDSPTEKLHVIGNIKSSGSVLAGTYVEAGTYARIKSGDIYAGTASGAQCHLQYDTTDECMKFIFD